MSSPRTPGVGLALLAVTGLTVLVAGCGGNAKTSSVARTATGTPASSTSASSSAIPRLVAYATCMRRNGVTSFPDPTSEGNLVINANARINPTSPQYERAQSACKKFSPEGAGGKGMTPAQHARALAALTRYVDCMRRHGIPMANPFSGPNGGVGIIVPRGVDPGSVLYERADAACKHFVPNGG